MGNRRLGKANAHFDIGGAQALVLANRGSSTFFESLQNAASGRVGDGVQCAIQGLLGSSHGEDSNKPEIDGCQCVNYDIRGSGLRDGPDEASGARCTSSQNAASGNDFVISNLQLKDRYFFKMGL